MSQRRIVFCNPRSRLGARYFDLVAARERKNDWKSHNVFGYKNKRSDKSNLLSVSA